MGIDASRSANNRSKQQERRKGFRNILCENLERREVMAGDILDLDFRLLSVAPNTGETFSTTRSNTLSESPRELIFRFAGGDDVRQSTLRNGIRISRSGGDGVFGTGGVSTDIIVTPEYLDFADTANRRVVVARFSQPLTDDLYNVEIFGAGADLPAQGINAVRNVVNDPLKPRKSGTDRDSYVFNLELGTKITAIVPQPLNRAANGTLSQKLDTIDVYFNDSELYDRKISTGDLAPKADPTVVDPRFYNLIATTDSVSPFDDRVFNPIKVTFDPATKMASLQFAGPINSLAGSGTYRLRIGSDSPISSVLNNAIVPLVTPATDPQGYLSGAYNINSGVPISNSFSSVFQQEIRTVSNPLQLDFPGSSQEPGHRDIQEDRSLRSPDVIWGPPNFAPDADPEIRTIKYNFMDSQAYGVDSSGRRLFTSITSEQKQRIREVFEFYSRYLGVDFQEYSGPTSPGIFNIIVGDMIPINTTISGPGDLLGVAGQAPNPDNPLESWDMAILDGSEPWDTAFGFGVSQKPLGGEVVPTAPAPGQLTNPQDGPFSFFTTAMHEIGHLLGLDHTYDLPAGTIMGSDNNGGTTNASGGVVGTRLNSSSNPLEQIFPGTIDQIHGQHAFRPDNRDVDLYRFELTSNGQVRLETIAERLNDSSNLDSHLTLLKRDSVTGALSIVSVNNNYISQDSLIDVPLTAGEYFVAITGKGNEDNDPQVLDTGSGATSQGRYQLRFDFKSTNASSISEQSFTSTAVGSALDGDGDGIAGGDFNFWFRTAGAYGTASVTPRTLIVDKVYTGLTTLGTLDQPFKTISAALSAAQPGDLVRLAGLDLANPLPQLTNVRAYEIGKGAFGSTLSDGDRLEVPKGVTLMIDAGAILKFGNARVMVGSDGVIDRSGAAIQVLGTPSLPVYFTAYSDQSLGIDTNPLETTPKPGDWGGIEIRNEVDRSQGRFDREREGIFLNTISNARMTYGGGLVGSGAQAKVTSPIEFSEARPLILGNSITRSADSAMSADPNSFEETLFTEPRYQNAGAFVPDYRRVGPVIYNNDIRNNTINGLFIRVETLPGQPTKSLTTHARIDDSEVTLVFGENLLIAGTPGGALNEIAGPNTSLMLLTNVAPTSGSGFVNATALEYIVTYMDRFGQESLPSASKSAVVPAGRSMRLSNIPVATSDYVSRRIYRRVNNTGAYQLAGVINKDDTTYVDNNITFSGVIQTLGLTELNRSRQDASLVIDPGIVAKLLGTRIEVGIGAAMIAEGTESKPVIFTSRLDDRYGAGGTFDTNNDSTATTGAAGNWSGILARHMSELSLDHAVVTFAGGESRITGGFASFNAIEVHQANARIANSLIERNASGRTNTSSTNRDAKGNNDGTAIFVLSSQPVIINNVIRDNSAADTAAISVDTTSLNAKPVRDFGRSTGFNQRETDLGIGNYGPLVFNNRLGGNGLNGMRVRGGTLTTESVWDDTDIVHILQSEIIVPDFHTFGGLRLTSKVDSSLVVKASNSAGITAAGRPLDIKDRIGGTVQVLGSQGFPVVITSLSDDTIGAGFDDEGASLTDTNNDGSASTPRPGDWRSVRFTPFSNDRNVDMTYENESDRIASSGSNDTPFQAQDIGKLAGNLKLGDENLRLGVTLSGAVASSKDMDVYRFSGVAGATVWLDIDQSSGSLDSIVELIDESGKIMALSDDSLAESLADKTLENPTYSPEIKALPMDQVATSIQNSLAAGSNVDFQGTNPRDAGMRVVLPGVAGTSNSYYIRVRSSNKRPGVVTDPYDTASGVTIGSYKLHVRLQETQEIAGSTVRYADLRYATNGIEVFGNTTHSPLVGEFAEPANDTSSASSSAIDVGNVMVNDRAGASLAGNLATDADIDWFNFSVGRDEDSIQQLPPNTPNTPLRVDAHGSLIFDIDYADGVGRANTQLWVFRREPGGALTLVLTADDSNIQDDQPAILKGTDQTDLTRGSLGKRDAYIGPIEMPPGDYAVAVTNKSVTYFGLTQFTQSDIAGIPGAAEIRLEPLDSVARLGEDRFEQQPPLTTASGAPTIFAGGQVPFTLADVTLFTARTENQVGKVSFLNPMTGTVEANMSRDGINEDVFQNGYVTRDIAVSPAGTAMGFRIQDPGLITDTNAGQFFGIDIGDTGLAIPGVTNSGIITWGRYFDANGNLDVRQSQDGGGNAIGDGMVFTGLTYSSLGASGRATFFGVATRRLTGSFNETPSAALPRTRNIIYQLDPDTGAAVNWLGLPTRTDTDYENGVYNMGTTAGTNVQEAGYFLLATGTVNGLTTVGNQAYGVSDQGELVTPTIVNVPSIPSRVVLNDPTTGNAINFTGLTRGPANVQNGRFADVLFGLSNTGVLYAFDTTGVFQPVFPLGRSSINLGTTAITGIDFTSLDVNLWHVSNTDPDSQVAGHGRTRTFNNSGDSQTVPNNTLRFAYTNPGDQLGIDDFTNTANTYAMPGGAWGAFESTLLDLSRYSSSDQPVMYFNYNVRTENATANNDGNIFGDGAGQAFMDSFRVYGSGEDGQWVLLTTNNSAGYVDQSYADGALFPPFSEYDVPRNGNQDAFGRSNITSSAFDNQGWRQARVNLGSMAGKRDVKIRFEFNSGGDFRTNNPAKGGFELSAIAGERISDGNTFQISSNIANPAATVTFEFDLGLVLNVPSGRSFKNGDQIKIGSDLYTFAATAGAKQIPFSLTDSPETIAASINTVLTANGYRVLASTASPNILNITHLNGSPLPDSVLANDYDMVGPDDAIITGRPGIAAGNVRVSIDNTLPASETAQAPVFVSGDFYADGDIAFADLAPLSRYTTGSAAPIAGLQNPTAALGQPDYVGNLEPTAAGQGVVSLGRGGSMVVQFADNYLTASGDILPDLAVYEVGTSENVFVEVSYDGITFTSVGTISGTNRYVDLDAFGFGTDSLLRYVRLTDDPNQGGNTGNSVGADIDAVGALSSRQRNVRDEIRTSLAQSFNVTGQKNNTEVWRYYGDTIQIFAAATWDIVDPGILRYSGGGRVGDNFGPADTNFPLTQAARRALNNGTSRGTPSAPMSVTIDDIVLSFAERGEMVSNGQALQGVFLPTFQYELYGGPGGAAAKELETGAYQLEMRTAPDYGKTEGQALAIEPVPFVGPKGRTFDTNDRLVKAMAIDTTGLASRIGDGYSFTVSNGVNEVTFEFNVFTTANASDPAYRPEIPGRIRIALSPNASDNEIALAVRDAINDPAVRALLGLTVENNGDMFGTSLYDAAHASTIQFNGNAASDLFANSAFVFNDANGNPVLVPNALGNPVPLGFNTIKYGQDTQWGEDAGDANIIRDQGQLIISGVAVSRSSQYGINMIPAPRDLSDRFINMDQISLQPIATRQVPISTETGNRPYPGSVRNLITLNNSRLAPGAVIVNNILAGNASGGIRVGGDVAFNNEAPSPVTVTRIVNNTIYGLNTGAGQSGIEVEANTSPTILSNILANLARGINVANDPALQSSIVIGANLYQGNAANILPAALNGSQSFPITLTASEPLFMDPTRDRFYLKAFSRAIDSSIASLEDRNLLDQVRSAVGLPTSPIIAPEFDAYGLLRSDDPSVSTPGGLGSNVFADRGALDRVDLDGPLAVLQRPLDNDAAGVDLDGSNTYVQLKSGNIDYFEILIDERQGTGPDPLTITQDNVVLTENGRMLSPGVDYVFGYSFNSRTIRLTPLAGFWRQDSVYELTLINKPTVRVIAPDDAVNRVDGDRFTVSLAGGGTKSLELDSGFILTVPAAGVSDGQTFTYTPAGGETIRFEFNLAGNTQTLFNTKVISFLASDTPDQLAAKIAAVINLLIRQNGWPVQAIPGGRVVVGGNVGDTMNVSNSSLVLAGAPGVAAGAIPVKFLPVAGFDAVAMSTAITQALNQVGSGVKAYSLANGLIFVEGVNSITGMAASLSIPAIQDLAGNNLQANRANSLTQFTILMPEVAVDYGDAVERPGTGSTSSTLRANNGVRHGLYPDDANLLVLGAYADGEIDGQPSAAADGDDFDSTIDFGTLANFLSVSNKGPARLSTSAFNLAMIGKSITISDTVSKSVTYEFTNGGSVVIPGARAVNLAGAVTAADVAARLQSVVLASILDGSITGIHASATGNILSLGGSSAHRFDLSNAQGAIARVQSGTNEVVVQSILTGLAAGNTMFLTDGYGNQVGFQVVDTNPLATPTVLGVGNVAVSVNLATVSPNSFASALATAINKAISDSKLKLPTVSVVNNSLTVSADDEEGVQFGSWFNANSLSTPVILTSSATGFVDAWIDWNQDNDFEDSGERILSAQPVVAGANTFYVTTPASASIGFTTARFRLSSTGGLFTYGLGIGGEVEDHLIEVLAGSPPVANADSFIVAEDNVLIVPAAGVLTNDTDADAQAIRVFDSDLTQPGIQPVRGPEHGSLTISADGSFVYLPKQDFFGTDTFVYLATDPRMTSNTAATVTITVTPVNDAPVAVDDVATINEDQTITWDGSLFTANDRTQPDRPTGTDGDIYDTNESGQTLRIVDAELVLDRGLGETLTLINNRITYTPPSDYNNLTNGPVLVRILIEDSGVAGGDEQPKRPGMDDMPPTLIYSTLTINVNDVNDPPLFNIPRPNQTPLEDASVSAPGFLNLIFPGKSTTDDELGLVSGLPAQTVRFQVTALDPTRFTAAGQPAIDANGTLTYTLNTDVNALNSSPILVEVIAIDNGNAAGSRPGRPDDNRSAPKTFTILPVEVNDAPLFTIPNPVINILEDLEVSPVASFVTNIVAGPPTATDELGLNPPTLGQTVSFEVTAVDPSRFNGPTGQPRINAAGQLTYDLAPDVNLLNAGPIFVKVVAVDSGPAAASRPGIPDVNRSIEQTFTIRVQDVNDAPGFTIPNATISIQEDLESSPLPGFLTNIVAGPPTASDEIGPPGQSVSFNVRALDPSRFSVQPQITPDGTLSYDLAPNVNLINSGPILVEVIAQDNGPATGSRPGIPDVHRSAPQTFTIGVQDVNDAPEFNVPNSTITINEDLENSPVSGFLAGILPGPSSAVDELASQTVSFTVSAADPTRFNGLAGQPQISPTGVLTYDLAPDVNVVNSGPILIKVRAVDNGPAPGSRPGIPDVNTSAEITVTLLVNAVNDAPLFTIPSPIISIDEDLENSPIPNFATNITAGPVTAIDELGLVAGVPAQVLQFDVQAIDTSKFNGLAGQPRISPTGTLTYDLAPDVNILNSGPILVRVSLVDNGSSTLPNVNRSTTQTFTIRVKEINDPPIFDMAFNTFNMREDDGFLTLPGFVTNLGPGPLTATDESNQTTTIIAVAVDPTAFTIQPLVTGTGDLTFQLAPDVNSLFKDTRIRLIATDNGVPSESTEKLLTLNVADINDEPQYTIPTTLVSVLEDNESVTGVTPTRIVGFATNVRPGPATAIDEVSQTLTFNVTFNSNTGLFSTQPKISSTGELSFVTAPNQNGTAIIIVNLVDNGRTGPFPNDNIGPNATFSIIVRPVNDAPEFMIPSSTTADEDQGVVSVPGFATGIRPGPITAGDESNQELSFEVVALDPTAFVVQPTIGVDGTLVYQTAKDINSNSGKNTQVRVTLRDNGPSAPPPNTNVSVQSVFTINIVPVNDPPISVGYLTTTPEDTRVTVQTADVLAKDLPGPADEVAEGQTIRMTNIEQLTSRGGVVVPVFSNGRIVRFDYIPPLNFVGQDFIRYVVTDDATYKPGQQSATGTITMSVGAINDPPQFTAGGNLTVLEDSAAYLAPWATNILAGPPAATDENSGPNAQSVSFEVTTNNDAMFAVRPAVNAAGQLSFTLAKDANGAVSIVVVAVDSGPSAPPPNNNRSQAATFTLSVTPVNDPPGFNTTRNLTVGEDSGAFTGIILADIVPAEGMNSNPPTALDEANQTVTISATADRPALFTSQPTIDANGVLRFTPAPNASGVAIVSVIATDNGPNTPPNVNRSQAKTFSITINPVNDAPIALDNSYSTNEQTILNVTAPGVLANDTDPDLPNDTLSIASFQASSQFGASVTVRNDGSVIYNPTVSAVLRAMVDGQSLVDTFTYRAKDTAGLLSNVATVSITVSGINDAPVANNDTFTVPFNVSELLPVLANDTDVDTPLDIGSIEIGRLPVNGTVAPTSSGTVRYTPKTGFRGQDTFTYRVRDSLGKYSQEATVTVNVNTAPVAIADSAITKRDTQIVIDVLANDFDTDGTINRSTVNIVTPPNFGTAVAQSDGRILFIPQAGFTGTATFAYAVSDNDGLSSNIANVTVQVVASLYQNPTNRFDVNNDSFVSPIDVLLVINLLNSQGASIPVEQLPPPPPYYDVNGNGFIDATDVLSLIDFINSSGNSGSGEGPDEALNSTSRLAIGLLAAPEPRVVEQAVLFNTAGSQANAWAAMTREQDFYGPAIFPIESQEVESTEFWASLADRQSDKETSADIDEEFLKGTWM
ncbi:MAG: Ig-like domain-containing protein [Planctomycetota bacterium]|nr:Ig-like domain-containing protein [Planctomycetota bacterium]